MKPSAWRVAGLSLAFAACPGCSAVHSMTKGDPGVRKASAPTSTEKGSAKSVVEFDATPEDLERAMPEAMADLQMTYLRTRKDGSVLQIDGTTSDQRAVSVTIRPGTGKSRLSSRIGWFGDTTLSNALAERVGIRAGILPPKPIPDVPPSSPDPNPIFSRSAVSDEEMYRDMADAHYRDRVIP